MRLPNGELRIDRYDYLARLHSQVWPDGTVLRHRYGASGRLARIEHSDGSAVDYDFDGDTASDRNGTGEAAERVFRARTERTETEIRVDEQDRPVEVVTRVDGHEFRVRTDWSPTGERERVHYPASAQPLEWRGRESDRVWQGGGREYAVASRRDEAGTTATTLRFANGWTTEEWLEARERERAPRWVAFGVASPAGSWRETIGYDDAGRVNERTLTHGPDEPAVRERFDYDDRGRLVRREEGNDPCVPAERGEPRGYEYRYDELGRLIERRRVGSDGESEQLESDQLEYDQLEYDGETPVVARWIGTNETIEFESDSLGRRVLERWRATDGSRGWRERRYRYDLLSQLVEIIERRGDGTEERVELVYDGFGRLVARSSTSPETPVETEYYAVDLDGHRLETRDAQGRVLYSYLWLGDQCLARVAGPLGGEIDETYHRGIAARVFSSTGFDSGDESFGAGLCDVAPDRHRVGFASTFGEGDWLRAGARWYDPRTAQFTTPDSWYGVEVERHLPTELRRVLTALPGGISPEFDAVSAYSWCGYEPVSRIDPGGHNFVGLIWSIISAHLWAMQGTSTALRMHVINIIWEVLQLIVFRPAWDTDNYWATSIFNMPHPVASYRLMVPYAFILNGLTRGPAGNVFTMGNIIWGDPKSFRDLEAAGPRTLIRFPEASDMKAAVDEVGADVYRVKNGTTQDVAATVNAAGTEVTLSSAAVMTVERGDWIAIERNDEEELRQVDTVSGTRLELFHPASTNGAARQDPFRNPLPADFSISPALGAPFAGNTVQVTRLDVAVLGVDGGGKRIARSVTFVRGDSVHFGQQLPDLFGGNTLSATEYLPTKDREPRAADFPAELRLLRLPAGGNWDGYAANAFVRLQQGDAFQTTRAIGAGPGGNHELRVEPALATPWTGSFVAVRLSDTGKSVNGQASVGLQDRVGLGDAAGDLNGMRPREGLVVSTAGQPDLDRIATRLFARLDVAPALPASLQGPDLRVDLLGTGPTFAAEMASSGAQVVANREADLPADLVGAPIRVTTTGGDRWYSSVESVNGATVVLRDAAPVATFANGTDVTAMKLSVGAQHFDVEATSVGGVIFAQVPEGVSIRKDAEVRIRPRGADTPVAVRRLAAEPLLVAELDAAMPAAYTSALTVRRFEVVDGSSRTSVTAPDVRGRLVFTGAPPYAVGETLHLAGGDEAIATVASISGNDLLIEEPTELPVGARVMVQRIESTGVTSSDVSFDESLILIPSDPDEDPHTRRNALEHHEMRHVWQYSLWGPFYLALPLPWLFDFGFSFSEHAQSASKLTRWFSINGTVDGLFGLAIWGMTGAPPAVTAAATIRSADRKTLEFGDGVAAESRNAFEGGFTIEVQKEGTSEAFNKVAQVDAAAGRLVLEYPLDEAHFANGDAVTLSLSSFEKIRKYTNIAFGNFEGLWNEYIPDTWGRALSRILNTDSWLLLTGWFPLAFLAAGASRDDQYKLAFEQDASYHSGEFYTNIAATHPGDEEVFVGQFSKIVGYFEAGQSGLSNRQSPFPGTASLGSSMLRFLRLRLPAGATAADVAGAVTDSVDAGRVTVRFREDWFVQFHEKIENAIGVYFSTRVPGTYDLIVPDAVREDEVIFQGFTFGGVSFLDRARVVVKPLALTPDPATERFETEVIDFTIAGDADATYVLTLDPASPGRSNGLQYTAPALTTGAGTTTANFTVNAHYAADELNFPGQLPTRLSGQQLQPVCRTFTLTIREITLPTVGPVTAGATVDFQLPIAAHDITPAQITPAGATVPARITGGSGRPAQYTFHAPDAITAATTLEFDIVFGPDSRERRTLRLAIEVRPS